MKAIKFSESIEVEGQPEVVFDYTQDYNHRLEWDTFLIEACLLGNAGEADRGVKAWCVARNGLGMETEYVSFHRPRVTAIKMTKGPRMFASFAGSWRFAEVAPGTTRVTFAYAFSLRFPHFLVSPVIRAILQRNVRQRLRDLRLRLGERGRAGNLAAGPPQTGH